MKNEGKKADKEKTPPKEDGKENPPVEKIYGGEDAGDDTGS